METRWKEYLLMAGILIVAFGVLCLLYKAAENEKDVHRHDLDARMFWACVQGILLLCMGICIAGIFIGIGVFILELRQIGVNLMEDAHFVGSALMLIWSSINYWAYENSLGKLHRAKKTMSIKETAIRLIVLFVGLIALATFVWRTS